MLRKDQFKRLEELQEKLCEVIFDEANPDNWPGAGKLPIDMTKEERGDRYWCKKDAAATFTLLNKSISVSLYNKSIDPLGAGSRTPEDELEDDISRMEKEAAKQLEAFERKKKFKVV